MASKFKLNIFELLAALDRGYIDYWATLSKEERKGFAPPVVIRWLSNAEDRDLQSYYLLMSNEANIWLNDLYRHPELQMKLLSTCGIGKKIRHKWLPGPSKMKSTGKVDDLFLKLYPLMNQKELNLMKEIYTVKEIKELAESYGMQDREVKEVVKDFKKIKK